jgi:hypothetical protein
MRYIEYLNENDSLVHPPGSSDRFKHSFYKGIEWTDKQLKDKNLTHDILQDKWLNVAKNKKDDANARREVDKVAFWDGVYKRSFQYWQTALDRAEKNYQIKDGVFRIKKGN